MTDWGAVLRDNVEALAGLFPGLSAEQLRARVPATPEWTVTDVLAHLAGGSADLLAGRMDGAPGHGWTARHVAERAGRSVVELLAELRGNVDAVAASVVGNPRPAVVWDAAVHHADLHEALGLGVPPERCWRPVLDAVGPTRVSSLPAGVPAYELFRAVFSRRSRAQVRGWGVDEATVEAIGVFGPRDDDQPVPA